jgi:thiol-disulfide isomerase/thioredoxin
MITLVILLAGCTAVLLAGCTAAADPAPAPEQQGSPFADCAALTAAPPSAAPATTVESAAGLPDLELPCFTGGQPVRLADVRGPAVINLWASWCEPCRTELPVMQALADRAGGRLHVLGVDTGDGRDAAASFGESKHVTMPTLFDRNRELLAALGRINLPITIFVDSAGRDYVHVKPLDAQSLSELVREHTGLAVTP